MPTNPEQNKIVVGCFMFIIESIDNQEISYENDSFEKFEIYISNSLQSSKIISFAAARSKDNGNNECVVLGRRLPRRTPNAKQQQNGKL